MVEFLFHGDINDLSVEQRQVIGNVFKEQGFEGIKIEVQPVGKAGDNYGANVKRITVERNGEIFNIVAKVAVKNEIRRALGNIATFFQNEHIMYNDVLPKLTELEKSANIPEEERLRYAICYGTYLEPPNELILLEDLQISGYKTLDKCTSLTDENVKLILKNFAMLHSLSFALKYHETETFENFCKRLVNVWVLISADPEMVDYFEKLDADVQTIIDDDKYKNAVINAGTRALTSITELAKIDSTSKFAVIQQGDSWTNNIMFQLENDRTVGCCMIDYQLSRLSSPVADLHYMIFNCTDHATRMKHFHNWIDYYFTQLDKRLTKFDLKIDEVYPRYQLETDLKMLAKVSLGQAIMVTTLVFRESADAAKLIDAVNNLDDNTSLDEIAEQNKLSALDSITIQKIKERLEGVVDSFIEFGYL